MPPRPTIERFHLEIEGVKVGTFDVLENLKARIDVVEYQDGDDPVLRKRPGRTTYDNVTLKKGKVDSAVLWKWWSDVSDGKFKPRTVSISLLNKRGKPVLQWKLTGCWPCEWQFSAQQINEEKPAIVMLEAITFVVEKIKFVSPVTPRRGNSNAN